MATLYAQSTGNWSEIDWNTEAGGTGTNETPGAADTLVSNSYTVTVDGSYTVTQVTNTSGGTFVLTNGITLTCTDSTAGVLGAATGVGAVTMSLNTPDAATLVANVRAGSIASSWGVSFTGTGSLTINGQVTGGTFVGADATGANAVQLTGEGTLVVNNGTATAVENGGTWARGINCSAAAAITVTGDVIGGGSGSPGFTNSAAATITIAGNLICRLGINSGPGLLNSGVANITITGNVTGGVGSGAAGINNTAASTITITGNVTGGGSGAGLSNSAASTITITGNVTGGGAAGINNTNASAVIDITGTLTASSTHSAVSSLNDAAILVTGPLISNATGETYGRHPILANRWAVKESALETFYYEMRSSEIIEGVRPARRFEYDPPERPAATDVRAGVTFGAITGTCAVPAPESVLVGVPVDDTVGTAVVSGADPGDLAAAVWDHLLANMETADSAGARLKNLASTDAVGGIVAALGSSE